ncbi:MAG: hypothetical protein ACFFD4_19500 [Candidatus Odinarchaeota archaeon]
MSEGIDDKVLETTFHCKICKQTMKFHIADNKSYVSKTEQEKYFSMQLVTYRVFHDTETERHHNTVLVDHKGFFRGYVDFYKENISSIEDRIKEKSEFWVISEEDEMDQAHSLIDTFLFSDLRERWILPVIHPLPVRPLEVIEKIEKKIIEAKEIYTDLPDDISFSIAGTSYKLMLAGDQAIVIALKSQADAQAVEKLTKGILEHNFGYKRGLPKLSPFLTVLRMLETSSKELNQETAMKILTDDLLHIPLEIPAMEHLTVVVEELKHDFSFSREILASLLSGKTTALDLLNSGYMNDLEELLSLVDFGRKLTEIMINGIVLTSSQVRSIVRETLVRHRILSELGKGVDPEKIALEIIDKEYKMNDPEITQRMVLELEKILSLDNYTDRMKEPLQELVGYLQDESLRKQKRKKRRFF